MSNKFFYGAMIAIGLVLSFTCYHESTCEKEYVKINSIGGCDRQGICGVGFSDDSFGEEYKPVIGQTVERCAK